MPDWKPWRELRNRPHLELAFKRMTEFDGLIQQLADGCRRIVLDPRLTRQGRAATLTHELIHDERNILFDDDSRPMQMMREEHMVEAETVRRLVPLDELDPLVRKRVADGGCVGWWDVREWFDVPQDIAERALGMLEQKVRERHPTGR